MKKMSRKESLRLHTALRTASARGDRHEVRRICEILGYSYITPEQIHHTHN